MREAVRGLIEVIVLAAVPAEAVEISHCALNREVPHPRLVVRHRAKHIWVHDAVRRIVHRTCGVNKRVDRRVVVGGIAHAHRALAEHETIRRRHEGLLAVLHNGPARHVRIVVNHHVKTVGLELEPVLDLEQLAGRAVRKPLGGHVTVRLLRILVDEISRTLVGRAALAAVHEHVEVTTVIVGQAEPLKNFIHRLLPDRAEVADRETVRVARVVQHEVGRAEERIVIREIHLVIHAKRPGGTGGGVGAMERAAGVERLAVVENARVVVHERRVHDRVVHGVARVPAVRVHLRNPEMIRREVAGHLDFAPAHEAFLDQRVARVTTVQPGRREDILRERADVVLSVARLDVERRHFAGRLRGNHGGINSIAGHGVARRAVVHHRRVGVIRIRINAVAEVDRGDAVSVNRPRGHDDGFIRLRQERFVRHVRDGWTGVRNAGAVHHAGRAEAAREIHAPVGFGGAAVQAEKNFGKAAQPAHLRTDGDLRTLGNRMRERRGENAVGLIVAARAGADVQTFAADEAPVLQCGEIMRALQHPAVESRLEAAVGDEVRAVVHAHLDFIHETFAETLQHDDERVVRGRAERFAKRAVVFDGGPEALAGVIAVGPVPGMMGVAVGIDQLHAAAESIAPVAPAPAVAVGEFADGDVQLRDNLATAGAGDVVVIGRGEDDALAAVGQRAGVRAEEIHVGAEVGVNQREACRIACHDPERARRHVLRERVRGEGVADTGDKFVTRQIRRRRAAVVNLHILVVVVAGDRVEHDLVDDDRVAHGHGVRAVAGVGGHAVDERPAVRVAALRYVVRRAAKIHDVNDARLVGVPKQDRLTAREQLEAELVLIPTQETTRRNDRAVGNAELVRARIVAQPRARQIHRVVAVIVEFNPVQGVAVVLKFVDEKRGDGFRSGRFRPAGRAAHHIALRPRLIIILAPRRTHQRE